MDPETFAEGKKRHNFETCDVFGCGMKPVPEHARNGVKVCDRHRTWPDTEEAKDFVEYTAKSKGNR
jgi:hypothetical protein